MDCKVRRTLCCSQSFLAFLALLLFSFLAPNWIKTVLPTMASGDDSPIFEDDER